MSCRLQMFINRLPLPAFILEIIKSFCLYDMKAGKMILYAKSRKRVVHETITMRSVTNKDITANGLDTNYYVPNFIYWVVETDAIGNGEVVSNEYLINNTTLQIQSLMCLVCGNYKMSSIDGVPEKIMCSCVANDDDADFYEYDDLYDDDDDDDE